MQNLLPSKDKLETVVAVWCYTTWIQHIGQTASATASRLSRWLNGDSSGRKSRWCKSMTDLYATWWKWKDGVGDLLDHIWYMWLWLTDIWCRLRRLMNWHLQLHRSASQSSPATGHWCCQPAARRRSCCGWMSCSQLSELPDIEERASRPSYSTQLSSPTVRLHSHWHEYESGYLCAGCNKHEFVVNWVCMYSNGSHSH